MNSRWFCLLLLLVVARVEGQDLSGRWEGSVTQSGKNLTYTYLMDVVQEQDKLTGTATATTSDGLATAQFSIAGVWSNGRLVLQEVYQIDAKGSTWCLKYATLQLGTGGDGAWQLQGPWEARGCAPGIMKLRKAKESGTPGAETPQFGVLGAWSGQIDQSDRDYTFHYEVSLEQGGKGIARIVSESAGGSGRLALDWDFNPANDSLIIREDRVIEKTDPQWKWCLKTLRMKLEKDSSHYAFRGKWTGFIEGTTARTGACAPGKVYLEKPILDADLRASIQALQKESPNQRRIKLQRTIEVSRPELTLRVWDNGTLDGDVISIFLNGQPIVQKHRLTKDKATFKAELAQQDNFLIVFSEDLGEIVPNTVAISVEDGKREQVLILSSDLKETGAVLIRQFRVN